MAIVESMRGGLRKVFGSRNDRMVKSYRKRAEQVNALRDQFAGLTDAELRAKTDEFKKRFADGENVKSVQLEAMAVMRESMDRNIGLRQAFNPMLPDKYVPFDVTKLSSKGQEMYAQVQEEIAGLEPIDMPGCMEPVPGWLQVDIPPALYAEIREAYPDSRPPFRAFPYIVQLIGAMVLYDGRIAEMRTGEGKTFVGPLACYAAVCEGMQCHVVTVNDYLVQRDRDWVYPALYKLGVTAGAIHPYHMQGDDKKMEAYRCDIVYGTNSEFGFDYLRDNMKHSVDEQMQKHRDFCIIDEVDSILIDEARTPLIISGAAQHNAPQYADADAAARELVKLQDEENRKSMKRFVKDDFASDAARAAGVSTGEIEKIISKFKDLGPEFLLEKEAEMVNHKQYYVVKVEDRQCGMSHHGIEAAQNIVGARFYVMGDNMGWDHLINNALKAHTVFLIDKDYVVEEGEVIIVDENTGRKMVGRQWSDGLHQAIETKEAHHGVKIKEETQTLATVTIQNFFKLYGRLAGMTGTAMTEVTEFYEIYKLDAVEIPTNRPIARNDHEDLIYLTEKAKWNAIVEEIKEYSDEGRAVLVGTTSVEKSEVLSTILSRKYNLPHEVLNAKNHARESEIVAAAGRHAKNNKGKMVGNVTIATNMAGRGTDIALTSEVLDAGGLHIIGTERHESRRIDNQLRGRAGRQGDVGSSRFYISMEDDLMKMFAGKQTMKALSLMGMKEDDAIEHGWITKSVRRAQAKVEQRNYQIRKNLLEYDELMEHQRSGFYAIRQAVLESKGIDELILNYIAESIEDMVGSRIEKDYLPSRVADHVRGIMNIYIEPHRLRANTKAGLIKRIREDARSDISQQIETSVGEYVSDDLTPQEWDAKGLSGWVKQQFDVNLSASQIKQMNTREIEKTIITAAIEQVDKKPLDTIEIFLEPNYVGQEIIDWAKEKFDIELTIEDLGLKADEPNDAAQQRVAELLYKKVMDAYREREISYPVQNLLDLVIDLSSHGEAGNQIAIDQLQGFVKSRYGLKWEPEEITALSGGEIYDKLIEQSKLWHGDHLKEVVSEKVKETSADLDKLEVWFKERFDLELDREELDKPEVNVLDSLVHQARAFFRQELTTVEQFVLLQILDQAWKDHLYAMDQLKDSIGLYGYAEKDPKMMYKMEGSRMFDEMLILVRDKVSDVVLKARLTPNVQFHNVFEDQETHFDYDGSTGVGEGDDMPPIDEMQMLAAQHEQDLEAAKRAGVRDERETVGAGVAGKPDKEPREGPKQRSKRKTQKKRRKSR